LGFASGGVLRQSKSGLMSAKKPEKVQKEMVVQNKMGIHARPASLFVKTANRYECSIMVEKDGETVNGKSIMGLMMLAAGPGSKIQVHCEGLDALTAIQELDQLIRSKFNGVDGE
jgi:phosphocarrier protein HPr